ncbi:MAG: 2Fe-2S iron-sulfur cluster-binding protein, partial [Pseudomonadales bacterium]
METIIYGVVAFTLLIVMLVGVLVFAKAKLIPSGDVTIMINGDPENSLTVASGSTLLNTLSANKIFIPSACGGKGSCGVCTVKVLEGGGAMLPTEGSFITRGEARE